MRDFLVTCIVLGVIFFAVGEWRGWYVGIASQTPMYVYKKDYVAEATRKTINSDSLPFEVSGSVQQGRVTVAVFYERPFSYQTGVPALPEVKVFEQTYGRGERIALDQVLAEGRGIYSVQLQFEDATGLFRVSLPTAAEL
ncbi:MAG TPA: hypothetical protein VF168_11790 [Trueperaceae bacterium]